MIQRSRLSALPAAALAATLLLAPAPTPAATYYVDFANGSDSATGLAPDAAWKRAPGDSRAGAGPRAVRLQPGDTILFRGGVPYRGTIVVRVAGTADAPIRYVGNGWGDTPALLDGSEPMAESRPCRSARDCGGEPGWSGLHRVALGRDDTPWDGLFQHNQPLTLAAEGKPLQPGTARPLSGSAGRVLLVYPRPEAPARFARGAGRVGFLLVTGGHVRIQGFQPVGFTPAPRFGPYAGRPLVQLQPVAGVQLAAFPPETVLHQAPPSGPAIAGLTSGPV